MALGEAVLAALVTVLAVVVPVLAVTFVLALAMIWLGRRRARRPAGV